MVIKYLKTTSEWSINSAGWFMYGDVSARGGRPAVFYSSGMETTNSISKTYIYAINDISPFDPLYVSTKVRDKLPPYDAE